MADRKIVGDMRCPLCNHTLKIRRSVKKNGQAGFLYYACNVEEGGCGCQVFGRHTKFEGLVVAKIIRWLDAEEKAKYKPETKTQGAIVQAEALPPEKPANENKTDWWDTPVFKQKDKKVA
ncbi:MAG: hypothetical protein KAJ75_04850 [Alphaproteobacteria bacterium]|nr:hypothetical protein [Alphaproteobacteria bacterium]